MWYKERAQRYVPIKPTNPFEEEFLMIKLNKMLVIGVVVALVSAMVFPAAAQDAPTGGVIIGSDFGSGPNTFSQIYCTDTSCSRAVGFMYAGLVGVDPALGAIVPNQPGALAEDWTVSDDNLVYTFTLRQDLAWSDGTPITSADIMLDWDLMNNPDAAHPDAFLLDTIVSVEAPDEYTLVVTFASPACSALNNAGGLSILPSHILGEVAPTDLRDLSFNLAPDVVSGAFAFGEFLPAERYALIGNDSYSDAVDGNVSPDGYVSIVVADQTVQVEQLLVGAINTLDGPPVNRRSEIRDAADLNVYSFPGNSWDYMAMNLADPSNPQPAFDEEGNRVDQGLHPIFGDKLVRQAIARAVNVDEIIEGAVFNEGSRMTSHIIPASWAYNSDLPFIPFDVASAESLLAEAGWSDTDGDGVLNCTGCLYSAEVDASFEGSSFEFTLYTNAGNTRREAIGTLIQDQLSQVGIRVNFQTIDFNTLLEIADSQTFDAFIIGWRNGYPDDPNTIQLFGAAADVPNSGFNFTSFYNERFNELEELANTVPGCDPEERAGYYREMQEIMQDELPYLWLFTQDGMYVANNSVVGFDPFPNTMFWNIDTWSVVTP